MSRPLRLLLIEDSVWDAEILMHLFRKSDYVVDIERVDSLEGLMDALRSKTWDAILADYAMPRMDISQALTALSNFQQDIPFIVVSGAIDDHVAASLMRLGVRDYFPKDNLTRLIPAIEREMEECRLRRERRSFEKQIHYQALHDSLTDLPNRALFNERLILALAHAQRHQKRLAIFFIDLDNFKVINDALGHDAGDGLLSETARRMKRCVNSGDLLARLGGDEFLLLSEIRSEEEATRLAQRLLEALRQPCQYYGTDFTVTASIGVSLYPDHGDDPHTLLRNADYALYEAKQQRRDTFRLYDHTLASQTLKKEILQHSLRRAVQRDELTAFYQPWLDIQTLKVTGMDALLRWTIPGVSSIAPQVFIDVLRADMSLMNTVETQIWKRALKQNRHWQDAGYRAVPMGLHLSARPGMLGDSVRQLAKILEETGLPPHCVDLSFSTHTIVEDRMGTIRAIQEFRALGIQTSLDDFGMGPVHLMDMQEYRFNAIKIHPSLVHDVPTRRDVSAVVSSAIALAHRLGMEVQAKGVETAEQFDYLREAGCDKAQGSFVGIPLPAGSLEAMLHTPFQAR